MGCCCSCEDGDSAGDIGPNERTSLLRNDPINADRTAVIVHSEGGMSPTDQTDNNAGATINEILHETANQFIDVSVLDGGWSERPEQMARAKRYSTRVNHLVPSLAPLMTSPLAQTGAGVTAPQAELQSFQVSETDVLQITSAAERMSAAVQSMRASGKDQLVIPLTTHQQ